MTGMRKARVGAMRLGRACFWLIAILILTYPLDGAHAEPGALTISPETVEIAAGTAQIVAVRLDAEVVRATLSITAPATVTSRVIRAPRASEHTNPTWIIEVTPSDALASATTLAVAVSYHGKGARTSTMATAIIKVDPKPRIAVATVMSGEIVADNDTLLDGQPGRVALKLTNLSDTALQVTRVERYPLASFRVSLADRRASHWMLAPRATIIRPIDVRINPDEPLVTGKHPFGLIVSARSVSRTVPWSGDLVVTKDLAAGIPGMTEIQSLLQIPSFLLFPGFLIIASFTLVWRLVRGTKPDAKPLEIAASPGLWIGAITISGAVVFAYPLLTSILLGAPRSILFGYDLHDLVLVWVGSIVIGGLLSLGSLFAIWVTQMVKGRRQFQAAEAPLSFLERLQRMGLSYYTPYVEEAGRRLYRLDPNDVSANVWLAPGIRLTPVPADADIAPEVFAANDAGDLAALIAVLREQTKAGLLTLGWLDLADTTGPTLLPRARVAALNPGRRASLIPDQ